MTTSKTPAKQQAVDEPVATETVSLDSLAKQRRDALPSPVTYELFGVEFTMPPMKSLPFDLQERIGSIDNSYGVMVEVVGRDKVREMVDAGFTVGDMELIAEDWQKRNGLEPGEAQASPAS